MTTKQQIRLLKLIKVFGIAFSLIALQSCATTATKKVVDAPTDLTENSNASEIFGSGEDQVATASESSAEQPSDNDSETTALDVSNRVLNKREGPQPVGLVNSAEQFIAKGQYEDAIRQSKAALKRNEKYVPAMVSMAKAFYKLGKYEFVDSVCDIALGIRSETAECHNLKGFVALENNDAVAAREQFDKGTQANSNYGYTWVNLGAEHLKTKNYEKAIGVLENAVAQLPNRAEAFLNLGSAYRGAGEIIKAQQAYQKALQLKPNYPAAYYNLGILYLDAQEFPGMAVLDQYKTAVEFLNRFNQVNNYRNKTTDADVADFIDQAERLIKRQERKLKRDAQRKAREAAKAEKEKLAAEADTEEVTSEQESVDDTSDDTNGEEAAEETSVEPSVSE